MVKLSAEVLSSLKKGISLLRGYERRQYVAELAITYYDGSATKIERALGVNRKMVITGLGERRTGLCCIDSQHLKGAKKRRASSMSVC